MYSKNDYRYYLEHQAMNSDDFLMHYGVKGMKWKHHKFKKPDVGFVRNEDAALGRRSAYIEFNKEKMPGGWTWSDKIGLRRTKNNRENSVSFFNTTNDRYWRENENPKDKKLGRFSATYAEDGAEYKLDLSKRKKKKKKGSKIIKEAKRTAKALTTRETPKGKKIGKGLYVNSAPATIDRVRGR